MSKPIRILVADDHPVVRRGIMSCLAKNQSVEVIGEAADGHEAVRKCEQLKPDLVLMDVVMPNLNGFQATRALSRDETTQHIPIILVTTKDQETDRVWGMRQGAKAYLTKPFNENELTAVIVQFLSAAG